MKNFLKRLVPMRVLYAIARAYWFFRRPVTHGARIVLENNGQLLLVRHTYQPNYWTFPGGGIKKEENAEDTLRREVKEEIGINLDEISYVGEFKNKQDFKDDTVAVYISQVSDTSICRDQLEILETRWFPIKEMPKLPQNAQKIFDIAHGHI